MADFAKELEPWAERDIGGRTFKIRIRVPCQGLSVSEKAWYTIGVSVYLIRAMAFVLEGFVTWLCLLRFGTVESLSGTVPSQSLQLLVLFGLNFLVSLPLYVGWGKGGANLRFTFSLVKILLSTFIVMLLPAVNLDLLPFFLMTSVVLALSLPSILVLLGLAAWILLVFALTVVFSYPLAVEARDIPLLVAAAGIITLVAAAFRSMYDQWRYHLQRSDKLSKDVERLMNVNVGFQSFASEVETKTLDEERKRLSREIHDTVGYSLTTIKILFEAAKGLIRKNPEKIEELMDQGLSYTKACLDEIRSAMRGLRKSELLTMPGLHVISRLVENFRNVTGMDIKVEYACGRLSYGPEIDPVLYKTVQESLTNSYRHGHASKVDVLIKESEGSLSVLVVDNGASARKIVKGIGMSGMEERIAGVGGRVFFDAGSYGFTVKADLPIREESA